LKSAAARRWRQDWESETSLVIQHDVDIMKTLAATMIDCDPRFEVRPGTKPIEQKPTEHDAFEVEVGAPIRE
jgi:hypothetical protein